MDDATVTKLTYKFLKNISSSNFHQKSPRRKLFLFRKYVFWNILNFLSYSFIVTVFVFKVNFKLRFFSTINFGGRYDHEKRKLGSPRPQIEWENFNLNFIDHKLQEVFKNIYFAILLRQIRGCGANFPQECLIYHNQYHHFSSCLGAIVKS
jgi:hypothetical protein